LNYIDYNEKKIHGKTDFPLQYYYVNQNHEQYIMPLHWHRELELIRVLNGTIKIFLNNILYTLNAGEQIIVQCGTLHRGDPDNCTYECLVFDPAMLCKHKNDIAGNYIIRIIDRSITILPITIETPETFTSINMLFEEVNKSKLSNELSIYSALYKFFSSLYNENLISTSQSANRAEKQHKTVRNIITWLQDNCTKNITLSDVACVGNVSEKYLCRLFKNYTSMTPIEYINNLRIENACHLMIYSNSSVTDAALESGFNDLSYFIKLFKRYKGLTPNEYKKLY